MKPIKRKELWNSGYCELYDFSEANKDLENRVKAVCEIAKVCRNLKEIKNPENLYKKLLTEHAGNPSEIFSFIPVDIGPKMMDKENGSVMGHNNFDRFCYEDKNNNQLTNYRNILNEFSEDEWFYGTHKEPEGFLVFKIKIPYMIVDHLRRHQMLNFSISENWRSNRIFHTPEYYFPDEEAPRNLRPKQLSLDDLIEIQKEYKFRKELVAKGEFGLRYTEGFIGGWIQDPTTWKNFFSVRAGDAKGTQKETKELANTMYDLIPGNLREVYL